MPNNFYTSPRVYLSKGYRSKSNIKTRSHFELGIGYTIPEGVDKAAFKAEYAKWEKKLKNSGFTDIEYRSPTQSGHFNAFFRENGSTATFQALYDPAKEEYYALARSFDAYMNERVDKCGHTRWAKEFHGHTKLYKTIWYLHIEGVPYRAVAKAFSGQHTKWIRGLNKVPKSLMQPRSVFWAHDHTHKILNLFWEWAKSTEGLADPRSAEASKVAPLSDPRHAGGPDDPGTTK